MWNLLNTIEEHTDRLHAFIRSRVGGEEDSWDVLQDVFTALTVRWNLGEALEDGAAWLFRVARNRIVDLYRRRSRSELSLEDVLGFDGDEGMVDLLDDDTDHPDEEHGRSELRAVLLKVIRNLPPEQREVFLQTELHGRKYADISEETGVALNTLLSRKRYAVLRLREAMDAYNGTER